VAKPGVFSKVRDTDQFKMNILNYCPAMTCTVQYCYGKSSVRDVDVCGQIHNIVWVNKRMTCIVYIGSLLSAALKTLSICWWSKQNIPNLDRIGEGMEKSGRSQHNSCIIEQKLLLNAYI